MSKYCDKIRVATLITGNKIVESHVTVILTVKVISLPGFYFLNYFVGNLCKSTICDLFVVFF